MSWKTATASRRTGSDFIRAAGVTVTYSMSSSTLPASRHTVRTPSTTSEERNFRT